MKTFYKTLSYGAIHVCVAATIAYLLTGNLGLAIGLSLIEPLVQTVVFFFHEKLWARFDQREKKPSLFDQASLKSA